MWTLHGDWGLPAWIWFQIETSVISSNPALVSSHWKLLPLVTYMMVSIPIRQASASQLIPCLQSKEAKNWMRCISNRMLLEHSRYMPPPNIGHQWDMVCRTLMYIKANCAALEKWLHQGNARNLPHSLDKKAWTIGYVWNVWKSMLELNGLLLSNKIKAP